MLDEIVNAITHYTDAKQLERMFNHLATRQNPSPIAHENLESFKKLISDKIQEKHHTATQKLPEARSKTKTAGWRAILSGIFVVPLLFTIPSWVRARREEKKLLNEVERLEAAKVNLTSTLSPQPSGPEVENTSQILSRLSVEEQAQRLARTKSQLEERKDITPTTLPSPPTSPNPSPDHSPVRPN